MVGGIYKIQGNDGDCYIGSCKSFKSRQQSHTYALTNKKGKEYNRGLYTYFRENNITIKLIPLEECDPNLTTEELRGREQYYYELLQPNLNLTVPRLTPEERETYAITYRESHKKEQQVVQQEWYVKNKNTKRKEYLKNNKETIALQLKKNSEKPENKEKAKNRMAEKYRQKICGQALNDIISQIELSLDD